MTLKRIATIAALAAMLGGGLATAQSGGFQIRLTTVPIDPATQATVTGHGQAQATLDGRRLTIAGEFEGLQGAASEGRLHMGVALGTRGPAIHEIEVTRATQGSISATLQLSAREVDALRDGRLYIQIASESAPEGNLWGWLLQ
jgi:hypothetical protein